MTATAILDLEKAGFSREQVEALARWHDAGIDARQLATKADLAELSAELKADLAELRAELRVLEHRMTIRLGGIVVAVAAALGAFLKLVP
jgi:DNA-binding transcriptional MerR regulator